MNGAVRVEDDRPPGATPRRRRSAGAVLVLVGAAVVLFGSSPRWESDRTAVTEPESPALIEEAGTVLPMTPAVVAAPLDQRVPGFDGTLVVTMATPAGTEVWRWSSGPGGAVVRSEAVPDIVDARPDPTGTWIVGIQISGDSTRLDAALDTRPVPVLRGVESYAWDRSGSGRIGWMESITDGTIALHAGRHIDTGIWFTPAGRYEPTDPTASYRVVGFDELGFVLEGSSPTTGSTVHRVDPAGTEIAAVRGSFIGISPGGRIALDTGTSTQIVSGPQLTPGAVIERSLSTAVWTNDGGRLAVAQRTEGIVDIIDGTSRTSIEVGMISPRVLAWDTFDRFLIVAGDDPDVASDSLLVFIDTVNLDVRSVVVTGTPVAAAVKRHTPSPDEPESVR